ncbi:MAG: HU family DNA-binding protein [Rubripirellula sp.]|nr:HU family DNA-binding protein [Rubripirellula sp.]
MAQPLQLAVSRITTSLSSRSQEFCHVPFLFTSKLFRNHLFSRSRDRNPDSGNGLSKAPVKDDDPELANLYYAELSRSHCDHLVVSVLQESKEGVVVSMFPPGNDGSEKSKNGHVVDMFPPGNDGTRPKSTGGTGSGDMKSGAVDHNTTRSNRGGIRDTGGTGGDKGEIGHHGVGNKAELSEAMASRSDLSQADPKRALEPITTNVSSTRKKADPVALIGFGSPPKSSSIAPKRAARRGRNPQTGATFKRDGSSDTKSRNADHNTTRSNRQIMMGPRGNGIGSGDTKSGSDDHNTTRSNRGGFMDSNGSNTSSESDVIQCEVCGASCTEPCRCNSSGVELIFGRIDDQLAMMQTEAEFTYLTFLTSYGMRSDTLISIGDDSGQTLVIAKGWGDCNDTNRLQNPGKLRTSDVIGSIDPNPLAHVGIMHNRALDYLTPDLNLNLLSLRGMYAHAIVSPCKCHDCVHRPGKNPGRTSYSNITLNRPEQSPLTQEDLYLNSCLFMSQIYGAPAEIFLATKNMVAETAKIAEDGFGYLENFQNQLPTKGPMRDAVQRMRETMMLSPDLESFNRLIDDQAIETLLSRDFTNEERSLVLGSLSLAKGTVSYWNAHDDIFDGDIIERGNGKFWADVGGFISGFVITVVDNELNNDDNNALNKGVSSGAVASAVRAINNP